LNYSIIRKGLGKLKTNRRFNKDIAIEKVAKMPDEQINKLLIFIAGMEVAEQFIKEEEKAKEVI